MTPQKASVRKTHPDIGFDYNPWTDVPEIIDELLAEYKRLNGVDVTMKL
ncbi:hypothetical protein ACOVJO_06340 [Scardovia wiggsiae]